MGGGGVDWSQLLAAAADAAASESASTGAGVTAASAASAAEIAVPEVAAYSPSSVPAVVAYEPGPYGYAPIPPPAVPPPPYAGPYAPSGPPPAIELTITPPSSYGIPAGAVAPVEGALPSSMPPAPSWRDYIPELPDWVNARNAQTAAMLLGAGAQTRNALKPPQRPPPAPLPVFHGGGGRATNIGNEQLQLLVQTLAERRRRQPQAGRIFF